MAAVNLKKIADRIDAHLKRFENDPKINKPRTPRALHPYFHARSSSAGRWVYVCYVSYQGNNNLTRDEAEKYLAWLDSGKVGKHFDVLRSRRTSP